MSSEAALLNLLRKRYPAPAWAFFEHVADATGHAQKRTIDAVAMGIWPSKGLDLHAFEVKVSRADWRRELDTPEKAAAWAELVDYFWIVATDDKVAKLEEVPGRWGLLTLSKGAKPRLVVRRPATLHRCQSLDRFFLAALLRKAAKVADVPVDELKKAEMRGRHKGAIAERERWAKQAKHDGKAFEDMIRAFNEASGLHLPTYRPDESRGRKLGEEVAAARVLLAQEPDRRLASAAANLRQALRQLDEALATQKAVAADNMAAAGEG